MKDFDFPSPHPRFIIEDWESDFMIRDNNRFPIYFYPRLSQNSEPVKHLIVMINGFDEEIPCQNYYYSAEWSLSKLTSKIFDGEGISESCTIASVLMPIPFHHWRRPNENVYKNLSSTQLILSKEIRLFLGFEQLVYDIDLLIGGFAKTKINFSPYISPETNIHILGYSLGGLAALACFIKDKLRNEECKISTCFLLASGLNVQQIEFRNAHLSVGNESESPIPPLAELEKKIKTFYIDTPGDWRQSLVAANRLTQEDNELVIRLFERIVLGYKNTSKDSYKDIEDVWISNCKKIHFFNCELDNVMIAERIDSCCPRGCEINQYVVQGVGHYLAQHKPWIRRGSRMVANIISTEITK